MSRFIAHMVTKDEAGRYLENCLRWLSTFVDAIHVYDDRSTDETVSVASGYAAVGIRGDGVPAFMEHEGRFRHAAWLDMESRMSPQEYDIIVCVDADEFPVSTTDNDERGELELYASVPDWQVCRVTRPEVFDGFGDTVYTRQDGYWGSIADDRIARWRPGGSFRDKRLACGSLPYHADEQGFHMTVSGLQFLHFGYADPVDRKTKYERYKDVDGHSSRHVESILRTPVLEEWKHRLPSW